MKQLKFHLVFTLEVNDKANKGLKCDEKKIWQDRHLLSLSPQI